MRIEAKCKQKFSCGQNEAAKRYRYQANLARECCTQPIKTKGQSIADDVCV